MIDLNFDPNLIFFILFCLVTGIQLFYYLWFYMAPAVYGQHGSGGSLQPVSVVICARNEAENLNKFLPSVLEQDYPSYEVIVVNDCSEDNSDDILGKFIQQFPHLRVSTISKDPKFTHSKKFAQFIGIKAAINDLLVFTDADCQPLSRNWLSMMASSFSQGTEIVLGYGGYHSEKGLLNRYIRYDTLMIAIQYLGMAIRGIPYMGVGRNLAYRRSLFFMKKGFGIHNTVVSGDDDLFVNANATKTNTRVEFRPESQTRSVPAKSLKDWVKQKERHLSTAKYYKTRDKVLLFLEPFSRITFYGVLAYLISQVWLLPVILSVFGSRLIIMITILSLNSKRLNEKGLIVNSLIFDIFSPLISGVLYFSMLRNRSRKTQWK